jgi:hypothetical protein
LIQLKTVGTRIELTEVDRQECYTSVYPDGEDYNPKKALVELYFDFLRCEDKRYDMQEKIELYNKEQEQKQ